MFLQTSAFKSQLGKLLKNKYRDKYGKCQEDLDEILKNVSPLSDFLKIGDILNQAEDGDNKFLLKVRVPNSTMKEGKSGGYRLICIYVKDEEPLVVLLTLYPKKGPLGLDDLSPKGYEDLIDGFMEEAQGAGLEDYVFLDSQL